MKKVLVTLVYVATWLVFGVGIVVAQSTDTRPTFGNAKFVITFPGALAMKAKAMLMADGVNPENIRVGDRDQCMYPAICVAITVHQPVQSGGSGNINLWGRSVSVQNGGSTNGNQYPVSVLFILMVNRDPQQCCVVIGQGDHWADVSQRSSFSSIYFGRGGASGYSYSGTSEEGAIGAAAEEALKGLLVKGGSRSTPVTWDPDATRMIAKTF